MFHGKPFVSSTLEDVKTMCGPGQSCYVGMLLLQAMGLGGWLYHGIEPIHKQVLGVYISRHRNMLVAESFLKSLIKIYGKHTVYSDGGTWYPEACSYLGLKHLLHTSFAKSIIERTIEYFKDRTESFDDYYPCIDNSTECDFVHVNKWLGLFVFTHNADILRIKFIDLVRLMEG